MLLFKRELISCRVNSAFAPEVRDEGSQVQAVVRPRRAWITYGRGSRAPEVREELPVPIDRDLPPGYLLPRASGALNSITRVLPWWVAEDRYYLGNRPRLCDEGRQIRRAHLVYLISYHEKDE